MPTFIAALFDLSFDSFITPGIAKFLYIIELAVNGLAWLAYGISGFSRLGGGFLHGVLSLLIVAPIGFLITAIFLRVGIELLMAVFKIAEYTHKIANHIADKPPLQH